MIVLVANIGSTSFKFRLFDMTGERELARGGAERIGSDNASVKVSPQSWTGRVADHGEAIDRCLKMLPDPNVKLNAIGFKAVLGGPISGAVRVDPKVIQTMTDFADIAPAHNPPYVAAMKAFAARLPDVPQVAAFETAFHATIPASRTTYGIPWPWTEAGVRRYGYHGASHKYIAVRTAELLKRDDLRIISCHIGGSSSICAIDHGSSVANSFGTTPQSGLPHNNRVGDFDPYALPKVLPRFGLTFDQALGEMARNGGLLGISGISNDLRDIERAATEGHPRAALATQVLVEAVRHYIGAYLAVLNGADVLVFTGGIGENGCTFRSMVCDRMDYAGIKLDKERNKAQGREMTVSTDDSRVRIMTIPTNEELIVARQTCEVLSKR
ncbi:MAG TPA: acetate/propionate family kinase [Phycisphaerae bacterium]|nr:acetate/propionate family kinase [Phycisphaerae bacterium]HRY67769.1 acetate/propionate family kinase [Phycisphaerae bacterium]HSA25221.1 acetate/propionate family kinase [Phycisphaerae bacterium]